MGTIKQGILGGFNGKVGTVVGSTWKGIDVMRSRPKGRKSKFSDSQLDQQARFALMIKFLQPLTDFLTVTYKKSVVKMTGFNKVFSDNIRNAITGVYPALTVDYPKVQLSSGKLPNGGSPAAVSTAAGKLTFNWTDNSTPTLGLSSDLAFVAAYSSDLDHWIFSISTVARNAATLTLDAAAFSGKPVQTWIGFVSADGNKASNSLYTGVVNVL
jgi:hypothetical protein